MNTYIFLCAFERSGIDRLVEKGHQSVREDLDDLASSEVFGTDDEKTTVKDLWFTTSESVDVVVVVRAANIDNAVAFSIALSSFARCRTTTLVAVGDVNKVAQAAFDAHTKMGKDRRG